MLGRKETKEAPKSRDKESLKYLKIPSLLQNSFIEIPLFGGDLGGRGEEDVVKI